MDERQLDSLLENEKEWRRFLVERLEKVDRELHAIKSWSLVFRVIGGALFALLVTLIQIKGE